MIEEQRETLIISNESMTNLDLTLEKKKKIKVKKKSLSEIERYYFPIEGLTSELVDQRISEGQTNSIDDKTTKSIPKIFFTNIFTFFNILMF